MTDRERLIEILRVPIYPHLDADPAEVVADYLLDNGVTFQESVRDCYWATEQAYKNGYEAGKKELEADNERLRDMWAKAVSDGSKALSQIPRWIPVAERLPEIPDDWAENPAPVLYMMKTTKTIYAGYYGENGTYRDRYFRQYHDRYEGVDADDVLCWMWQHDLPEPPKGE